MTKYIFVTGGVTSSLGKGIISASLAKLLQARGLSVTIQKFDPYINVDPGTLNPYEHGECYVTDDGAETDLDLGHYERFLNISTSQANNVTTGRVYLSVITKEREGMYLGKTVQVIPHITDEIKRRVKLLADSGNYDIIITELGGTVGDIESLPYIEALRQMRNELGKSNCLVIHLTLIPYLSAAKELKTKPTQHSVKELLTFGIQPEILVCRTEHPINADIREKLALFCNVEKQSVIEARDAESIYDVPLMMLKEHLDQIVLDKMKIESPHAPELDKWKAFLGKLKNPTHEIKIALIGKYNELQDAYKSIYEAFVHAGAENECRVLVTPIHSEELEQESYDIYELDEYDGVVVAPGFGVRGIDGKLKAIQYVRENDIPFFGIGMGMQCAVLEFGQNVANIEDVGSVEIHPDASNKLINFPQDSGTDENRTSRMRLGAYECVVREDTHAHRAYNTTLVSERHRHRFEFDNNYRKPMEEAGMVFSGVHPESGYVEIIELPDHPWFVGVQFHPELKSRVEKPHPLFTAFVKAVIDYKNEN